jgi:hypothetical protein
MSAYDQGRAQAHLRRFKNNYVINNNGARNAALRDGKARAKWVLPLGRQLLSDCAGLVRDRHRRSAPGHT